MVLHRHVLALDIASFVEALTKRTTKARRGLGRATEDDTDDRHRRLLCPRRQRPRRGTAEQCDELAAPHYSITSSARASTVAGISRLSALAVLRLITSANLVACMTGRSDGFAPLRTRPT